MIKITKDITQVPESLIPAFHDMFPTRFGKMGRAIRTIPILADTTHKRRMEIINSQVYTDHTNFNSRYKLTDIKNALQNIYKGKCAFCEQKVESVHIEHYRPKTTYYWLAYSWDNLLISCPTCNQNKGINFPIDGHPASFSNTEANIRSINTSSSSYDIVEQPKMVNPEVSDPEGKLQFDKTGKISSNDPRFHYTIQQCKIDRSALNDSRRAVLDRFREHIRDSLLSNTDVAHQRVAVATNIRNFCIDSQNENEQFIAFRKYAIMNDWLNDIVKGQN